MELASFLCIVLSRSNVFWRSRSIRSVDNAAEADLNCACDSFCASTWAFRANASLFNASLKYFSTSSSSVALSLDITCSALFRSNSACLRRCSSRSSSIAAASSIRRCRSSFSANRSDSIMDSRACSSSNRCSSIAAAFAAALSLFSVAAEALDSDLSIRLSRL